MPEFNSSFAKKAEKRDLHVHEKNGKLQSVKILSTAHLIQLIECSGTNKQGDR
jgi:hypothetical protein